MDNAAPPTQPQPPDARPDTDGPRVSRSDVADLGRLRRTVDDRHIAGVAGGLARHLDIDPVIVRVALVVMVFFGGAGLLVYIAAWILVPEEGSAAQPLGLDDRSRSIALIGVGVLALLSALGDWAGAYWFPWPVALAAVGIVWLLGRKDRGQHPTYDTGPTTGTVDYRLHPGDTAAPAGPPAGPAPQAWVRPPNPRKRGPKLFWFTLALIALAMGVLGVVDLAGAAIVPSAYPAVALGITALMLVVGSFWGRAGGLILVGLLTTGALGVTLLAENVETDTVTHTPTSSAQVLDLYELGAGEMVLDLSQVRDLQALDGRDVQVDVGAGKVVVVVPDDLSVTWTTDLVGGRIEAFGQVHEGFDPGTGGRVRGGPGSPEIDLDVSMVAGEIYFHESGADR